MLGTGMRVAFAPPGLPGRPQATRDGNRSAAVGSIATKPVDQGGCPTVAGRPDTQWGNSGSRAWIYDYSLEEHWVLFLGLYNEAT